MSLSLTPSSSTTSNPLPARHPRLLACILCSTRKIKCDRNSPCSNCIKSRQECISAASQPPRRRKKRFPEAELLARLRLYEELLRKNGVNLDELNDKIDDLAIGDEMKSLQSAPVEPRSSDKFTGFWGEERGKLIVSGRCVGQMIYLNNNLWTGLSDEFRDAEEVLHGSSEDEMDPAPITSSYDNLYPIDGGGLLFGIQKSEESLTSLHPQPVHIFRLWQTFIENVNPLMKMIHVPSTQKDLLSCSGDLKNVSKSMEALMFAIYSVAITSLDEAQCLDMFGKERGHLLAQYQAATQHALTNAGFLRSPDMMVLQALLLYLCSIRQRTDPRSLFLMTGLAVRSAQRMGLDQNTTTNLPPFQIEMRRRLWWQIVILDSRVAELSGAGVSILTQYWNIPLPLNVNDSELYPDMKSFPKERTDSITEMSACLIRCEIGNFLRNSDKLRKGPDSNGYNGSWQSLSSPQIPLDQKDSLIDSLETLMIQKYSVNCDPQIPLHFLTMKMVSGSICKMRLVAHHPRLKIDRGATMTLQEREDLFRWSLTMIEDGNKLTTSPLTKGYLWHLHMNMPLDAYIFLLSELRMRPIGELADRAWCQINQIFENYGPFGGGGWQGGNTMKAAKERLRNPGNTFHIALSNLGVKAWEAREEALRSEGRVVGPAPKFILELRETLRKKRKSTSASPEYNERSQDTFSSVFSSASELLTSPSTPSTGITTNFSITPFTHHNGVPKNNPLPAPSAPHDFSTSDPISSSTTFNQTASDFDLSSSNPNLNPGMVSPEILSGFEDGNMEMDWAFWDEMIRFPMEEMATFGMGDEFGFS